MDDQTVKLTPAFSHALGIIDSISVRPESGWAGSAPFTVHEP